MTFSRAALGRVALFCQDIASAAQPRCARGVVYLITDGVLLAESKNFCELLLRHALFLSEPLDISADQFAHIHAREVSGLHSMSLSTIVCSIAAQSSSSSSFGLMSHVLPLEPFGQVAGDVARPVVR